MKWINSIEQIPSKDNEYYSNVNDEIPVLVYNKQYIPTPEIMYFNYQTNCFTDLNYFFTLNISEETWWMYLPEAPELI